MGQIMTLQADSLNCGTFIRANARSTGLAKLALNIKYEFNACVDQSTGLPYIATRIIREGNRMSESEVYYYHDLRPDSSIVYSKSFDSLVVEKNIFDMLTGFYYFRSNYASRSLAKSQSVTLVTFVVSEVWPLTVHYAGEETIKTIFGPVDCLKFMPETEVGTYFRDSDDMIIWVTNDQRKIPVKIYIDLRVGSITADLKEYVDPVL